MEWGPQLQWLLDEAAADPTFNPPALRNRAEPSPELLFYWRAFFTISQTRNRTVGLDAKGNMRTTFGAITLSEIAAFCDLNAISGTTARMDLVEIVQALDAVYLEKMNG